MGQKLPQEATIANTGPRRVERVATSARQLEGAGFEVHRPFPRHGLAQVDPFLLLDELGPRELLPGEAQGAPDHPHRGFETVTYLLAGESEHKDSQGNHGVLRPGDVQWMTAGDGVIHSEMPTAAFQARGGLTHGFQLWVNLPRADKRMRPRYQDVPAARIPEAQSADGRVRVRVIAGESLGKSAVIATRTPILYLHVILQPGGRLEQPAPEGFNLFAYVLKGEGLFGPAQSRAKRTEAVLFERDGVSAVAEAPLQGGPLEFLLIGGKPLGEPVARHGPFVMNTEQEILEAIQDFQEGRFGKIPVEIG
jgi:quercetin 2,3-dioxygenase